MQTRKEPVKNKIVEAALEEFLVTGYENSSMRNIATQSGITVGNIYSYFSSKDDLFDYLLADTVTDLQKLLQMDVGSADALSSDSMTEMAHSIVGVFLRNRIQFLILMDGSGGSKYQNIKAQMIQQACERIVSESGKHGNNQDGVDPILAQALAVALIEGLIHLFKRSGTNKKKLEKQVGDFLGIIIKGFY
ncbi:MAG: TetR/AcrR family transcriptional regulator [Saccharofermentanales bacterium]